MNHECLKYGFEFKADDKLKAVYQSDIWRLKRRACLVTIAGDFKIFNVNGFYWWASPAGLEDDRIEVLVAADNILEQENAMVKKP